ncbi:DUF2157 domain-containing protein [Almyronema epifaneia]|uniref:DUF2157 domain-containing protein n=1 Tax=Almyronema epifaneia S1 TaxID=2991925 RepID=A0ABW6IFW8_9CYAN
MASEKFRQELAQALPQWQQEGLINDEQRHQLASRYQLDQIESNAQNRFTAILIGLGAILLGIGAITFVAANWQAIPRNLKLLLLLTAFVGVNAAGFELWQHAQPETGRRRLGQGLLLLGALLLGANLALGGQLFHRSGSFYDLCLAWSLGTWLMAYSLRLTPLGILAVVLLSFGYWSGLWQTVWGEAVQWRWTLEAMPLLAAGLFISLAYRCHSKAIFGLGAIAVSASYWIVLAQLASGLPLGLTLWLILVPYALFWAYRDRWGAIELSEAQRFQPIAQRLAIGGLGLLYYVGSFYAIWSEPTQSNPQAVNWDVLETYWLGSGSVVILSVVMLWAWITLGWRDRPRQGWRWSGLDATIAFFLLITAGVAYWHWVVTPVGAIATLIFNLLLFLTAVGCIQQGLNRVHRGAFWFGIVLLTLQVLSRVFEYETGLLLKSGTFVLCGVLVIIAGIGFERHRHRLAARSVPTHE